MRQQNISNQLAGFSGWDGNSWQPFSFDDLLGQQFVGESPLAGGVASPTGNNSLYMAGAAINALSFTTGAGEYSNVANGMWRGINNKWNSLSWGGNQWTGARSKVLSRAGAFKIAGRSMFYAGILVSGYQGYSAYQAKDYSAVSKSGFDIGMGAFATFGGPPGWIVGGGYFVLDAFGMIGCPASITPYSIPLYPAQDNTYVAPPIIFPQR